MKLTYWSKSMKRFAISANIPMELKERLKVAAERELCSESVIIRRAIAVYVGCECYIYNKSTKTEHKQE